MSKSDTIANLAKALVAAQGKLEFAAKDSTNPFFKSKYADLTSIIKASKEVLTTNGLAIAQIVEDDAEIAKVTTMLMHTSGEWISSTVALKPKATDPQAMGSAITYARRYGYSAIIGLSAEDDDGNQASQTVDEGNQQSEGEKAGEQARVAVTDVECEVCGKAATEKRGMTTGGKPYHGIFCSTKDKKHTRWLWN